MEELISAIENTPGAIMSLIKTGNPKAIGPIVNKLSKNYYNEMKSSYLDYINKYGAENKMVQSIAQRLGLPAQYAETNNVSCGESISLVIRKLPGLMDEIPALSEKQILLEYESIRQKKYLRELLHGSPAEMKNKVKEQLTADVNWLSAGSSQKKTSFNIRSAGWTVAISTNYIRGNVIISYEMILWRANHNNEEIYYLSVSGERNW